MPIPMPSEEEKVVLEWIAKIIGGILSFVAGIVIAAWTLGYKLKGYEDRLSTVEEFQKKCAGNTLEKIDNKIDWIIQEGLPAVHSRVDSIKDQKQ